MRASVVYGAVFAMALSCAEAGAVQQELPVLPATNYDANVARVIELTQQLADRDALVVGLRADMAVCEANHEQTKRQLQSVVLTDDVTKVIARLQRAYPGSIWVWDNEQRRITRVQKENK